MIEQLVGIGIGPIIICLILVGFVGVAIYKGQTAKKNETTQEKRIAPMSEIQKANEPVSINRLQEIPSEIGSMGAEILEATDLNDQVQESASEKEVNLEEERVLVAIITASIAASLNKNSDRIIVKSLRRVQPTNRW